MSSTRPRIRPNLMVENVRETITYYQNIFDFTVGIRVAEGEEVLKEDDISKILIFATLSLPDGEELFLQQRASFAEDIPGINPNIPLGGSFALYVEVDNVDNIYEKIKDDAHSTILYAPKDQWYGMREIALKDMNGYILTLGQMNEQAAP